MRKILVASLVFVSMIPLFLTFIPNVLSQPQNVEVLSYSWYITDGGYLVVVGEVQNVSPNIIDTIRLEGVMITKDGEPQAVSDTRVFSDQIHPQQKAPFIMYFPPQTSYTGDYSWLSIGIDRVDFWILYANQTDYYQYPDLEIIDHTHQIDSYGFYTVTGHVRNTGNQAAGRLWVVATFYNASGDAIATGFSDFLTPDSLPSGQTTSFTVTQLDSTTQLATQITDYTLMVQTEGPIIPEFPSFLILPLFMVTTLLAVIVYRKRLKKASK